MDTPFTPPTTGAAIQQCLALFSGDLTVRYCDEQPVPSRDPGVHRYVATRRGGSQSFIAVRTYAEPLTASDLDKQRTIVEGIRQSRHPHLCPLTDCRIEPHGHYIISGPVGTVALHEYLRQRRHVAFAPLCEFIALLTEALEAATEARWPRSTIDPHSLLLSACTLEAIRDGVSLAVPPLPGPELRATDAPPLPASSIAYVQDLALLVCDLLGSPARVQRFKPIATVGAMTNQFLRFVLEGQWQNHITSARAFALALRESGTGTVGSPVTFGAQPTPAVMDLPAPPLTTAPPVVFAPPAAAFAPVHVPVVQVLTGTNERLPRQPQNDGSTDRLRLKPVADSLQSVVTLCLAPQLTIGRSASSDHMTQFIPSNPRNDQRTCMISREHLTLKWVGGTPCLVEPDGVNQSFVSGQPLGGKLRPGSFTRVSVAGEYDLDMHRLASWWPQDGLWQDQKNVVEHHGAMLLLPMQGIPVLDARTLWLFTDAAFGIETNGALDLQPASMRDVIGWFVRDQQTVHVVTAESDGVVRLNDESLQARQPRPLKSGDILRVGTIDLNVS